MEVIASDTRNTADKDARKKLIVCNALSSLHNCVCRELGFTPVEVNASDTRNKADKDALKGVGAKLANSIKELATNAAIDMGQDNRPKKVVHSLPMALSA